MDARGEIIWDELIKAARKKGVRDHFARFVCDNVVTLGGEKTLWKRLNNYRLWLSCELEEIQNFCQAEILQDLFSEPFRVKKEKK